MPILTRPDTEQHWMKLIRVYANDGQYPFRRVE